MQINGSYKNVQVLGPTRFSCPGHANVSRRPRALKARCIAFFSLYEQSEHKQKVHSPFVSKIQTLPSNPQSLCIDLLLGEKRDELERFWPGFFRPNGGYASRIIFQIHRISISSKLCSNRNSSVPRSSPSIYAFYDFLGAELASELAKPLHT